MNYDKNENLIFGAPNIIGDNSYTQSRRLVKTKDVSTVFIRLTQNLK